MKNLKTLKSVHYHLEYDALSYKYPSSISSVFQKIRDQYFERGSKSMVKKTQWEIDFFSFVTVNGECKTQWSGVQENGEVVEYPTFSRFNSETYNYLEKRLYSTSNILLQARYSHLLWCSPHKHSKHAKIAIDAYMELVDFYKTKSESDENFGHHILNNLENAFFLSIQVRYKKDEIKNECLLLIKNYEFDKSWSFKIRMSLADLILKNPRIFKVSDLNEIDDIYWKQCEELIKSGKQQIAIDMLEIGEKISKKISSEKYNWRLKIAQIQESLITLSASDLGSISFCQEAIQSYKILKDHAKIKELNKKFKELKENLSLGEYKTDIELTDHVKACRKIANELVEKNTPESILQFLILDKSLLPIKANLEKEVKDNAKQSPLYHLIPPTLHDPFGNPVQSFKTQDEIFYYHILQQYDFEIRFDKIHLINAIIYTAIRDEKLTTPILTDFLMKNSWFGKDLVKRVFNKSHTYNWLDLIIPAIHEYFVQIKFLTYNKNYYPNLIVAIDSLTLKIEGLIRDFCHFGGVTTFFTTKDKNGNDITREKDIHSLLYEDIMKSLFDEDDLLFFRFLLVEKAGYNIRHKVAHSLMVIENYALEIMNLLFICLLKIGKYTFKEKVSE